MERSSRCRSVVLHQSLIEAVAVVGAIADQSLGELGEESFLEGVFYEFCFMRRSAGHEHGERKTMAVADRHDFAALTASSRADGGAPFRRAEVGIDERFFSDRACRDRVSPRPVSGAMAIALRNSASAESDRFDRADSDAVDRARGAPVRKTNPASKRRYGIYLI